LYLTTDLTYYQDLFQLAIHYAHERTAISLDWTKYVEFPNVEDDDITTKECQQRHIFAHLQKEFHGDLRKAIDHLDVCKGECKPHTFAPGKSIHPMEYKMDCQPNKKFKGLRDAEIVVVYPREQVS
jgi:hypothetical protein